MGLCRIIAKYPKCKSLAWQFATCCLLPRDKIKTKRFSTGQSHINETNTSGLLPFDKIPGPESNRYFGTLPKYLPFIGEYSMETLHKNAQRNYELYGRLVRERITPSVSILHVFDPRHMELVFRNEGRYPDRRSHLALQHYRLNKPEVYNTGGLLSTNGSEWWRLRSSFQKHMTSPRSVKGYVARTDLIAQEFVNWLHQEGCIQDMLPYLNRLFLEITCAVAFDMRLNSFSKAEQNSISVSSQLIKSAFESNSGILKLDHGCLWKLFKTPLYKKMSTSQEYLEKFSTAVLASKLHMFEESTEKFRDKNSLLDLFLGTPDVDVKDVLGMMVDVLMAAIDTTSYSTSFLLYHLATNPHTQQKLFQECSELLPRKDGCVTSEAVTRATYSKACIKESLRLNPVSIGVGRVLQSDMALSGYHVPKGTVVVMHNMLVSRLRQHCSDPMTYKPERWLRSSDQYESIHPFLSLPFGFGPRSCIARRLAEQTMCISLMKIVRSFQLQWNAGYMDVKTLLINKPHGPVRIEMYPRNY